MNDEQPTFKVTDRRLFNADGSPRDLPPEEKPETKVGTAESVVEAPQPEPVVAAPSPAPMDAPMDAPIAGPIDEPAEFEDDLGEEEIEGAQDPTSFVNFLMSIASNAASSLGMMEHPVTGKREVDLELGKHWIDILGMLQQKTRGNLLAQEQQVLEGLLADLRMQFVSLTNSTQSKARKFTGSDITGAR